MNCKGKNNSCGLAISSEGIMPPSHALEKKNKIQLSKRIFAL